MYATRSRSFPAMLLAALLLLCLAVTLALAADQDRDKQKEERTNAQQDRQAPAATNHSQEQGHNAPATTNRPNAPGNQERPAVQPQPTPRLETPTHQAPAQTSPAQTQQSRPTVRTDWRNDSGARSDPYTQSGANHQNGSNGSYSRPDSGGVKPYPSVRAHRVDTRTSPQGPSQDDQQVTSPETKRPSSNRIRTQNPGNSSGVRQAPPLESRQRPQVNSRPEVTRPRWTPPAGTRVAPPQQDAHRLKIPEAPFRGPDANRRVVTIPTARQSETAVRFRDIIRQSNARPVVDAPRLQRDVVGHQIPRDARFIDRGNSERVRLSYGRMESHFGVPTHYYTFLPRLPSDYDNGYWDGWQDGYQAGRRHHHRPVVINFYYAYYYADPGWFGFYCDGYYASPYHYFGYVPGWVYPGRVYVYPDEYIYAPTASAYRYYSQNPRLDERGAQRAISDIRQAWFDNDMDLFGRHLTDEIDVQVYFDGEYNYTTASDDYYGMTADALATTQTEYLEFNSPIFISSNEAFYTGRHEFYDPDGNLQTVYLSYRLRKLGAEWYIVAIGTSLNPIQHQYKDFRY
jgi:hypothetical protein